MGAGYGGGRQPRFSCSGGLPKPEGMSQVQPSLSERFWRKTLPATEDGAGGVGRGGVSQGSAGPFQSIPGTVTPPGVPWVGNSGEAGAVEPATGHSAGGRVRMSS